MMENSEDPTTTVGEDDDVENSDATRTTKVIEIEFAHHNDDDDDFTDPSSEFPVLCGLAEPIDTSPSSFPVDLASFAAVFATEPTHHGTTSCRTILAGLAVQLAACSVVWIKILLLASILIDSINPRCTSNGQCKSGEFCMPLAFVYPDLADWPTPTRGNSFCNDCLFATVLLNTNETNAIPEAEEFLSAGRDYCANDDPQACDFLRTNRGKYSYLSLIVLCCLCGMFGRMIYLDLHKLHVQQRLYELRFARMTRAAQPSRLGTIRVCLTGALHWFAGASRAYVLPSWMFTGAALLLTTWAPTTRNLLIVPIQIGLIANFDMVLEFVFFRQSHKDYTTNAARALEVQPHHPDSSRINYDRVLAVLVRLYSFGLAVQIPVFVLLAESIYPSVSFFKNAMGPNNPKYNFPIPLPCNDVVAAGIFFPMLLSVPMTLLLGPVAHHCRWTPRHVLGYVSTFVFVLYSCFLVREMIFYLQFQSF